LSYLEINCCNRKFSLWIYFNFKLGF
jgi:hypothetical protein